MREFLNYTEEDIKNVTELIAQLNVSPKLTESIVSSHINRICSRDGNVMPKSTIIKVCRDKNITISSKLLKFLKMKSVRTHSGVVPVTVLTKPFPCPGQCIFCPNDIRMPKSYLSNEPGAQRALSNKFDPYLQTYNRLVALAGNGHSTQKVELIVLGGTWSVYPDGYQIWFVKRCFDALNDFDPLNCAKLTPEDIEMPFEDSVVPNKDLNYNQNVSFRLNKTKNLQEVATWEELFTSHKLNELALSRCVGFVLETRPDEINQAEVLKIRKLGATKVQLGVQSLDDTVLSLNKRAHTAEDTKKAVSLLREAGFKIHVHIMPNLYGSTPENDIDDFKKLYAPDGLFPDEIKVYPCSLIPNTPLVDIYKKGLWKPYSHEELKEVLVNVIANTPRYTRLTRIIRDIPSTDILVGNKHTNFRQIAEDELKTRNLKSVDTRSREIKSEFIDAASLSLNEIRYETRNSTEVFLEYVTKSDQLIGFLRLSFPKFTFVTELTDSAIIREVHVYGVSLKIGEVGDSNAQHLGIGKKLLQKAEAMSKDNKYPKISVISSIGTKEYYRKNGYSDGELYQFKLL